MTPYTKDHFRSNTCRRIKESKISVSEDKNITEEALLYNDIYKYLLEGAYREEATKDEN